MTRAEINKAPDSEIIVEYVESYSLFVLNVNIGGGTKKLSAHLQDLEAEMLKRGILTEDEIKRLNE